MAAEPQAMDGSTIAAFRLAMRRFVSSVSVITTCEHGVRKGMTATAVSSVCMEPPALLMCINRSGSMHGALSRTRIACVNFLGADQATLCEVFSRPRNADERFAYGRWENGWLDLPYLAGAQANIALRISAQMPFGTHDVFIGEVIDVRCDERIAPLLYLNGGVRPNGWTPSAV